MAVRKIAMVVNLRQNKNTAAPTTTATTPNWVTATKKSKKVKR